MSGRTNGDEKRGSGKYSVVSTTDWSSMDDCVVEQSTSMSWSLLTVVSGTVLGVEAAASSLSFSETPSCHFIISKSGRVGKAVFGKTLGNSLLSARCTISKLLTAFCSNGTCSSGPSSS